MTFIDEEFEKESEAIFIFNRINMYRFPSVNKC
jgi:hypothetical protein